MTKLHYLKKDIFEDKVELAGCCSCQICQIRPNDCSFIAPHPAKSHFHPHFSTSTNYFNQNALEPTTSTKPLEPTTSTKPLEPAFLSTYPSLRSLRRCSRRPRPRPAPATRARHRWGDRAPRGAAAAPLSKVRAVGKSVVWEGWKGLGRGILPIDSIVR